MASSVPGTLLPNDEELMETIVTEGARAADSSAAHRPAPPAPTGDSSPTTRVRFAQDAAAAAEPGGVETEGPSRQLWLAWKTVDADGSGTVSRVEFQAVHLALDIPKDRVQEAWLEAVAFMGGKTKTQLTLLDGVRLQTAECNYSAFRHAFNMVRGAERRTERHAVRSAFMTMQSNPTGMKKQELGKFVKRMERHLLLLPPAFDLAADWETMVTMTQSSGRQTRVTEAKKAETDAEARETERPNPRRLSRGGKSFSDMGSIMQQTDETNEKKARDEILISFPEFEKWWKFRMVRGRAAAMPAAATCTAPPLAPILDITLICCCARGNVSDRRVCPCGGADSFLARAVHTYLQGLWETSQQVIPEFFDYKLDELAVLNAYSELPEHSINEHTARSEDKLAGAQLLRLKLRHGVLKANNKRTGKEMWAAMKPKMHVITTVLKSWGDMDNKGSATSGVHHAPLPWNIRDPESTFSGCWDIASVVFLLYVCATVPIRACFPDNIEGNKSHLEIFSTTWCIDTITDIYFILDVILNFFTALPNKYDGTPISDFSTIRKRYLTGWFLIDFLSSLPVEYMVMIFEGTGAAGADVIDLQFLKTLRLLRLAKMLRLARLKRILQKYENLSKVQEYGGIAMLLVVIMSSGHLLTCLWYAVGDYQEVLQGEVRYGWVEKEWSPSNDTSVSLRIRYSTALYSVFNLLDRGSETQIEQNFAVFGHTILLMVDGAVAGVMSALIITMQGNEREYNERINTAKEWMKEQRIPKFRSEPALEYFRTFYKSNVAMQEKRILSSMTPSMRMEFSSFLYSKFVANVPLFHGLSPGIVRALCHHVEPIFAVREQTIYGEGTTGRELYIVISGELEISADGARLGFISDGGFFGETPILDDTAHAEVRRRTVKAVTACKICYLHADNVAKVKAIYPELALRLLRCSAKSGKTKGAKFQDAMDEADIVGVDVKPAKPSTFKAAAAGAGAGAAAAGAAAGAAGGALAGASPVASSSREGLQRTNSSPGSLRRTNSTPGVRARVRAGGGSLASNPTPSSLPAGSPTLLPSVQEEQEDEERSGVIGGEAQSSQQQLRSEMVSLNGKVDAMAEQQERILRALESLTTTTATRSPSAAAAAAAAAPASPTGLFRAP